MAEDGRWEETAFVFKRRRGRKVWVITDNFI